MYRRTKKYDETRQRALRAGRDRARMARAAPDYAQPLPDLRMRITITRFDFGEQTHVIELHKTRRIDQYRAQVNGQPWKARIGLSGVLAGIRKSLPRVISARSDD